MGTLQVLLKIERQGSTSNSTIEKESVHLRHSHDRLREIARNLGFDVARLLCTRVQDDPILCIGLGRLCLAVSDHLGHV